MPDLLPLMTLDCDSHCFPLRVQTSLYDRNQINNGRYDSALLIVDFGFVRIECKDAFLRKRFIRLFRLSKSLETFYLFLIL